MLRIVPMVVLSSKAAKVLKVLCLATYCLSHYNLASKSFGRRHPRSADFRQAFVTVLLDVPKPHVRLVRASSRRLPPGQSRPACHSEKEQSQVNIQSSSSD